MRDCPRILAIDTGVNCGYAYIDIPPGSPTGLKSQVETAGVWLLANTTFEDDGMRYLRLEKHLFAVDPDMIMYEQVKFIQKSRQAAAVYHSIVNTITMFCKKNNLACTGVDTSTLKKRAVGKGGGKGTKKPDITNAANEFFGTDFSLSEKASNKDHNIADAMWLLQCGIEQWGPVLRVSNTRWPEINSSTPDYFPGKVRLVRVGDGNRLTLVRDNDSNDEPLLTFSNKVDSVSTPAMLSFARRLVELVNSTVGIKEHDSEHK